MDLDWHTVRTIAYPSSRCRSYLIALYHIVLSVSLNESEVALQLLRQDCVDLKEDNDKLFLDKERLEVLAFLCSQITSSLF